MSAQNPLESKSSDVRNPADEPWVKRWERGLKIQKAVDYARCVSDRFEIFFGKGIFNWLYIYEEGGASAMCIKEREWEEFCAYYRDRFAHDAGFLKSLDRFEERYRPHLELLERITRMHLETLSDAELWQLFREYKVSLVDYFSPMATVVYWESVIEDAAHATLEKHFEPGEIEEKKAIVFALSTPNYLLREEQDLCAILELPASEREATLRAHADRYAYIPMYDYDYAPYPLEHFRERLATIDTAAVGRKVARIRENAEAFAAFLREHPFSDFEKEQLTILHMLVNHKDERSHYRSLESFRGRKLYEEIGRRIGMPLGDLMFLLDEEIGAMLAGGARVDVTERKQKHCLVYERGSVRVFTGEEMTEYLAHHLAREEGSEVRGLAVSRGVAKGVVRIIKTINDLGQVREGDVLVTSMTRPEYVAAMKKCAGIVTDEGGLLCHAAIISRELGIPCIVGTKVATQVLKDGDVVEVDADAGIVRKI